MPLGNQGPTVIAVVCTEAILAGGFIGTRIAIRKTSNKGIGIDDWFLISTWVGEFKLAPPNHAVC